MLLQVCFCCCARRHTVHQSLSGQPGYSLCPSEIVHWRILARLSQRIVLCWLHNTFTHLQLTKYPHQNCMGTAHSNDASYTPTLSLSVCNFSDNDNLIVYDGSTQDAQVLRTWVRWHARIMHVHQFLRRLFWLQFRRYWQCDNSCVEDRFMHQNGRVRVHRVFWIMSSTCHISVWLTCARTAGGAMSAVDRRHRCAYNSHHRVLAIVAIACFCYSTR